MRFRLSAFVIALLALAALTAGAALADVSIFDIQLGLHPEGTVVDIDGVVVTAVGYWGYCIQEPSPHPTYGWQYSGIWVFSNAEHTIHKGDVVNVRGSYEEYFGLSEIDVPGVNGYTTYVGPGTIPAPVPVTLAEVNDTGLLAESYESVLIRVDRLDPTLYAYAANEFGEWYVRTENNGTGDSLMVGDISAKPGDDFEYDVPPPGTMLSFVQGILTYAYDNFMLAPRSCVTDLGAGCKPRLRGAYATGTASINVQFGVDLEEASAENLANYELSSGIEILTATLDPVLRRVVHLTTGTQPNGSPEQIIVSGVRSEGGTMMDPNQTYNFRSGITPIFQIQFVANPAVNDASALVGNVVTIRGRITAVEGNYYYLQDGDGTAWRGIYARVANQGAINVRDDVQVAGVVTEYYGSTQLAYRSGVDHFLNYGFAPTAVTTNTVTADVIPFRGTLRAAERWENCLVRMNNATIQDSIAGTAGPYFGEWLLRQPAIPDTAGCDFRGITPVSYDACPGNRIDLTGILRYEFNQYRIAPRTGRGGDVIELYATPTCAPTGVESPIPAVSGLVLQQNRPNPFGPATSIRFELPSPRMVVLEVVDVSGRLIRTLTSGPLSAGPHDFTWDGTNMSGRPVASGTYFYRLRAEGKELSRRMVLLP